MREGSAEFSWQRHRHLLISFFSLSLLFFSASLSRTIDILASSLSLVPLISIAILLLICLSLSASSLPKQNSRQQFEVAPRTKYS